jgi:hypothetical protein
MDMLSLDEFLDRIAAKCVEEGLRYDFDVSYKPIWAKPYYDCRLCIEIFDVDDEKNAITYRGEFIIPDGGLESTILRIRNWLKDVLGWDIDVGGDG